MCYNTKFGPTAQTPEQRAWVLAQMRDAIPGLKKNVTPHVHQLFARYVAGELSWPEVRRALNAASD